MNNALKTFRNAASIVAITALAACTTTEGVRDYAAYGYLTPGLNSEPELIGVYSSLDECRDAADGWTTRQVVGNPIHAECYPVDTH